MLASGSFGGAEALLRSSGGETADLSHTVRQTLSREAQKALSHGIPN